MKTLATATKELCTAEGCSGFGLPDIGLVQFIVYCFVRTVY